MKQDFTIPGWSPDNNEALNTINSIDKSIWQMLQSYTVVEYEKTYNNNPNRDVICFCAHCGYNQDGQVWIVRKSITNNENNETTVFIEPRTIKITDNILDYIEYNQRPFCKNVHISPKQILLWFVESVNSLSVANLIDSTDCSHKVAMSGGEIVSEFDYYLGNFTETKDKPLTLFEHCPICGEPIQLLDNNSTSH